MPNTWIAKPGMEVIWVDEGDRFPFEAKVAFMTTILMWYPVYLCLSLDGQPSTRFWFGSWIGYVAYVMCTWEVLCIASLRRGLLRRSMAAILVILLPAAAFAAAGQVLDWQVAEHATRLVSQDCDSFGRKAALQQAWQAAQDFEIDCEMDALSRTSATRDVSASDLQHTAEELLETIRVEECPNYQNAGDVYGNDWAYLSFLEKHYHCAGWCTAQPPIWRPTLYSSRDSCSVALARVMSGSTSLLCNQITIYAFFLFACTSIILVISPKSMAAT